MEDDASYVAAELDAFEARKARNLVVSSRPVPAGMHRLPPEEATSVVWRHNRPISTKKDALLAANCAALDRCVECPKVLELERSRVMQWILDVRSLVTSRSVNQLLHAGVGP